ncbi:MAG: hypothetical protein AAGD01_09510 [Acidobacteriota bacterium]
MSLSSSDSPRSLPSSRRASWLRRLMPLALGVLLMVSSTGCVSLSLLLKLDPQGEGGTIEQEVRVQRAFVANIQLMLAGLGATVPGEGGSQDLFSEETLASLGSRLGPGVTLVEHEKIEEESAVGARAIYRFESLADLRADNLSPTSSGDESGEDTVLFTREKGKKGQEVVTIRFPEADLSSVQEGSPMTPEEIDALRPLLQGLSMDLSLEVPGKVVEANTPHVEGRTITLFALDLDALLEDGAAARRLMSNAPTSVSALREALAGAPGVKLAEDAEVKVVFEGD